MNIIILNLFKCINNNIVGLTYIPFINDEIKDVKTIYEIGKHYIVEYRGETLNKTKNSSPPHYKTVDKYMIVFFIIFGCP